MVVFKEDGQGFYDFDLMELEEKTSKAFATCVRECLKFHEGNVKVIEIDEETFNGELKYYNVFIITEYRFTELYYSVMSDHYTERTFSSVSAKRCLELLGGVTNEN